MESSAKIKREPPEIHRWAAGAGHDSSQNRREAEETSLGQRPGEQADPGSLSPDGE